MDALLYTATSGASRVLQAQQVRANNLSNADTTGFRADMERAESVEVMGTGFSGRTMVQTNSASTRFSNGALENTGRPLDVAINGNGFFTVRSADGREAYTRAGNINVDTNGNLTINGFALMGDGGPLVLPDYQRVEISSRGVISVVPPGGSAQINVGQLKLINPEMTQLQKESDGLLRNIRGGAFPADETVQVAPEHLESSNVSAIDELVGIMSLTRNFEMQIRVMKTAETLADAGNQLMSTR